MSQLCFCHISLNGPNSNENLLHNFTKMTDKPNLAMIYGNVFGPSKFCSFCICVVVFTAIIFFLPSFIIDEPCL